MLPVIFKQQKNIIKTQNNYCLRWVNMQECQVGIPAICSQPRVGQHAGIKPQLPIKTYLSGVGQHAGMVGQHAQE